MKLFPIVFFLLAVACLAVAAAQEARDGICNAKKTPTKLIARRTWPSQTANTTTTTTDKPTTVTTTVTTTSSSTTTTAQPSTVSTTAPTTRTTTTPLPINVDCFVNHPGCGVVCTNATSAGTGVVQSRNFPGDYGKDGINCIATIIVPEGKTIRLEFTTFNLETKIGLITVGDDDMNIYLIDATGSTIPSALTTLSNIVDIFFVTSPSNKPDSATFNWQATYTAV